MSISTQLKALLEKQKISFRVHEHAEAFTAQEIAGEQHLPGDKLLKAVIIRSGDAFFMVVLNSNQLVDFTKLAKHLDSDDLELANEEELTTLFPDYELGAEPPFGNLYGLRVLADPKIQENDKVFFNAGTHTALVEIKLEDFLSLAQPEFAPLGRHI